MRHKPGLAIEEWLAWLGLYPHVGTVRQQFMRVDGIGQVGLEYSIANDFTQNRVFDGKERLNAVIEVALHHIRASKVNLLVAIVAKVENAAVFQKSPHLSSDMNVLAHAGNPRTQTTHAAHNQVNAHARLRCTIEQVYDLRIDQRIHFENEPTSALLLLHPYLSLDTLCNAGSQTNRSHQQLAVRVLTRITREHVKQLSHVSSNVWATGKQAQILVDARGSCIIIARSKMHIAAQALLFLAHDHSCLRVRLQTHQPINNMYPRSLQRPCPLNIVLFIKTCFKLHQDRHLLAILYRFQQHIDDR